MIKVGLRQKYLWKLNHLINLQRRPNKGYMYLVSQLKRTSFNGVTIEEEGLHQRSNGVMWLGGIAMSLHSTTRIVAIWLRFSTTEGCFGQGDARELAADGGQGTPSCNLWWLTSEWSSWKICNPQYHACLDGSHNTCWLHATWMCSLKKASIFITYDLWLPNRYERLKQWEKARLAWKKESTYQCGPTWACTAAHCFLAYLFSPKEWSAHDIFWALSLGK